MPAVKKGESRNEYVGRAIPELKKEGLSQKAAIGKAEGLYTGRYGLKKKGR